MPDPAFVIVGTPRSGTTLLQRLASELRDVAVPPETHFFSLFIDEHRPRFPLHGAALADALAEYTAIEQVAATGLRPSDIAARLTDPEHVDRPVELFAAVVRALAEDKPIVGEKTPSHLLWWRPLTTALPHLKVVGVIRDPRAVVASNLAVEWGMRSVGALAGRWLEDERLLADAAAALGPARFRLFRYEDVVADPESARERMAAFLGVEPAPGQAGEIATPRETWKARATSAVTADRVASWTEELGPVRATAVAALCRVGMARHGYEESTSGPAAAAAILRLPVTEHTRFVRFRRLRGKRRRVIDRTAL